MMKEIFEQISLIRDALYSQYSPDYQKIEDALHMAEQWLYIEANKEKMENTQEFQLGRLDGYIEACEDIYKREKTNEEVAKLGVVAIYLLHYIYSHENISLEELAEATNCSYDVLTNIMKKIVLTGAVKVSNKGYYLSEIGKSIVR